MAGDLRSALRCSEAEPGGRDHAVLAAPAAALCIPDDTFFTMEARRLQRQTRGQRLEKGIVSTAVEVAVLLGLGGVGLAALRERIIGKPGVDVRYLSIPIVATSCIIGWAASNTLTVQDNLPAVWAKTWAWLLCVWAMWLYEPNATRCPQQEGDRGPFSTPAEQATMSVFLSLEALTFLWWVWRALVRPLVAPLCRSRWRLEALSRIRPSTTMPGWSSFRIFLVSPKRYHFQYDGDRDAQGRPHGRGVWREDSVHGEILSGQWCDGRPAAPFLSRTFGSGAISLGLRIGFGTTRPEGVSESSWRMNSVGLRLGVLGVECSVTGGFMAHLPQTLQHHEVGEASEMLRELDEGISAISAQPAMFGVQAFSPPTRRVALIFIHGYNCQTDWACMRLGQLLALSKLHPVVLPIVYSWSGGKVFSYYNVLQKVGTLAAGLPQLLEDLHSAGISEFHLLAHSAGCEILTAALPQLQRLPLRPVAGGAAGAPQISTVSLFNASNPEEGFLAAGGQLDQLLGVCGRVTLYCDEDDFALRSCEQMTRRGRSIGRRVQPIPAAESRVDIVNCTAMEANVAYIRHSYFDLNVHVLGDYQELLTTGCPASQRSRLVCAAPGQDSNVYSFLAPPAFVCW